ncbi:uncharacterized protein LOC144716794 [Wolffia australiana]
MCSARQNHHLPRSRHAVGTCTRATLLCHATPLHRIRACCLRAPCLGHVPPLPSSANYSCASLPVEHADPLWLLSTAPAPAAALDEILHYKLLAHKSSESLVVMSLATSSCAKSSTIWDDDMDDKKIGCIIQAINDGNLSGQQANRTCHISFHGH